MKKMSLDLSQEGLQKFCLHHIEKVILVVSVILLGLYFWLGYSAPVYSDKNPEQLKQLAAEAERHIKADTSWEKIKEFRKGDATAHERIQQAAAVKLDVAEYVSGPVLGPRLKTLGLRLDPDLTPARELLARSFRAPMIAKGSVVEIDRLGQPEITPVSAGGGGIGPGDRDEENQGERQERSRPKEKSEYGELLPEIQKMEMLGVRPKTAGIVSGPTNPQSAFVMDIVSITGLVDFETMWAEYERKLANAKGYYPPGDKPDYKFVQVERRVDQGDWSDITSKILDRYSLFPNYSDGSPVTPEVIDPHYYDEILTMAIPPITMADYRPFATHPKVPLRNYVPKSVINRLDGKKETEEVRSRNYFDQQGQAPADSKEGDGQSNASDVPADNATGGRDDRSSPQGGGSQTKTGSEEIDELKGSNREPYKKVMKLKRPKAPVKLLRIFDFDAPVGKTVEYRVRVWVLDPNVPTASLAIAEKTSRPGEGVNIGTGGGSGSGVVGDDPGGGVGGGQENLAGGGDDYFDEKKYTRTPIDSTLIDPEVRRRLNEQAKNIENFKTDLKARGLDKFEALLKNCRPTDWSEPSAPIVVGRATADFYAGEVGKIRTARVDDALIPIADPTAKLVASVWDKVYNTAIPAVREIGRADYLNFKLPKVHIVHPMKWDVRVLENAEAKTDAMVVDIMGGLDLPIRDAKLDYQTPGEILLLDANGNFRVQNNMTDLKKFRHSLLLDDELSFYGKAKKVESESDDEIR